MLSEANDLHSGIKIVIQLNIFEVDAPSKISDSIMALGPVSQKNLKSDRNRIYQEQKCTSQKS